MAHITDTFAALALLFLFSLQSAHAGEIHILVSQIIPKRKVCICEEFLQDQRKPRLGKQPTYVAALGSGTLRHIHQN